MHVIWPFMETWADGCQPFVAIDGALALFWLRQALAELGIPDARKYRTQDLRRGHSQDMAENGCTLDDIMAAGQWKSKQGPTPYLDWSKIERDAVKRSREAELEAEERGIAEMQAELELLMQSDDELSDDLFRSSSEDESE